MGMVVARMKKLIFMLIRDRFSFNEACIELIFQ